MIEKIGWIVLVLTVFGMGWMVVDELRVDRYCQRIHVPTMPPVEDPATSEEYLRLGDYEYERGYCQRAINNYYRAIRINPNYAEAYNNRAYVNMRLHNYENALTDLDRALELRPNYPHALINRGDIRNYYHEIDREKAIEDYDKVIGFGKEVVKSEAVCGHRLMAKHNGNWFMVMWDMLTRNDDSGCVAMYFEK